MPGLRDLLVVANTSGITLLLAIRTIQKESVGVAQCIAW